MWAFDPRHFVQNGVMGQTLGWWQQVLMEALAAGDGPSLPKLNRLLGQLVEEQYRPSEQVGR
jgi:hypothetical protein